MYSSEAVQMESSYFSCGISGAVPALGIPEKVVVRFFLVYSLKKIPSLDPKLDYRQEIGNPNHFCFSVAEELRKIFETIKTTPVYCAPFTLCLHGISGIQVLIPSPVAWTFPGFSRQAQNPANHSITAVSFLKCLTRQ